MGCAASAPRQAPMPALDVAFVNRFVELARDDNLEWTDHRRPVDGPRGAVIESLPGPGPGLRYWRGRATVRAPIDIVAYFLGEQNEFNALADTIDPKVLGQELAALTRRNRVQHMATPNARQMKFKWVLQMPSPLPPREFVITETTTQLPDGAVVILSQSADDADAVRLAHADPVAAAKLAAGPSGEPSSSEGSSADDDSASNKDGRAETLTSAGSSEMLRSASAASSVDAPSSFSGAGRGGRGTCVLSGYLLEPVADDKYTQVTFLSCLDPQLSPQEAEAALTLQALREEAGEGDDEPGSSEEEDNNDDEDAVERNSDYEAGSEAGEADDGAPASRKGEPRTADDDRSEPASQVQKLSADPLADRVDRVLGMARILGSVESPRRHFEDPKALWAWQLFRLASADMGEFGFESMEVAQYGEEKLQTGTHVTHRGMGHGIIKQFDLMGRAHVRFDSGEERVFDRGDVKSVLSAAVEVGTRVQHPARGWGTVKRFDDEGGKIHVKFDTGDYHRYNADSWKDKIKVAADSGRAYGNVTMSKCQQVELEGITKGNNLKLHAGVTAPSVQTRRRTLSFTRADKKGKAKAKEAADRERALRDAEALRITFVVAAPAPDVLDYVMEHEEDEKAGSVVSERVVKEHSARHKTLYQRVHYPQGLNDRDFVYDSFWQEVDDETFIVVQKSTESNDVQPVPAVVRGNIVIRGFLLQPLYDVGGKPGRRQSKGDAKAQRMTRVTYLTCVEPGGFVPAKVIATQNRNELLGVLTDMRAFFYLRRNFDPTKRGSRKMGGAAKDKLKRRSMRRKSTIEMLMQKPGT